MKIFCLRLYPEARNDGALCATGTELRFQDDVLGSAALKLEEVPRRCQATLRFRRFRLLWRKMSLKDCANAT